MGTLNNQLKSKKGGARPNAGRKSKKEELGLTKLIDEVVTKKDFQDLFEILHQKAMKGSVEHIKLLLAYKYGKPETTVNMMGSMEVIQAAPPTIIKKLQQSKK